MSVSSLISSYYALALSFPFQSSTLHVAAFGKIRQCPTHAFFTSVRSCSSVSRHVEWDYLDRKTSGDSMQYCAGLGKESDKQTLLM